MHGRRIARHDVTTMSATAARASQTVPIGLPYPQIGRNRTTGDVIPGCLATLSNGDSQPLRRTASYPEVATLNVSCASVPIRVSRVNAGLKLPENQRFEIVGFLALSGRILWFDPRREYSSIPTANSRSRRAQGLSRLAASSRPPAGLGLDWPEHGGILDRIGAGGAHHIVGKFKPLVLGEIHAAGDIPEPI
jgi:hypothetical protein